MADNETPKYLFKADDHAIVVDRRERRYLIHLNSSGRFHSHVGTFEHAEIIGQEDGSWITTPQGHHLLVIKPTMADFTREMPRIATVVYPKDLGAIITCGDIFPGAYVLEAGVGSGAVTIALLRAVGEQGRVVSYDLRDDMAHRALKNVDAIMGGHPPNLTIKLGDVYSGFEEEGLDRIVLDLPEPWHVVSHASAGLVPGGILLSFLPTILQVHDLTQCLRRERTFQLIETTELLLRTWSVGTRSVRPSHRMVGHTGFITTARKCSIRPTGNTDDEKY